MNTYDNEIEIQPSYLLENCDICIHSIAKTECKLCKYSVFIADKNQFVRNVMAVVFANTVDKNHIVKNVGVVLFVFTVNQNHDVNNAEVVLFVVTVE